MREIRDATPGCLYRTQRKSSLAMLYFPEAAPAIALQRLRRWIVRCRPLREELFQMGYDKQRQYFLKREVSAIVKHLGEP